MSDFTIGEGIASSNLVPSNTTVTTADPLVKQTKDKPGQQHPNYDLDRLNTPSVVRLGVFNLSKS
jgi:hypothetical protein